MIDIADQRQASAFNGERVRWDPLSVDVQPVVPCDASREVERRIGRALRRFLLPAIEAGWSRWEQDNASMQKGNVEIPFTFSFGKEFTYFDEIDDWPEKTEP